MDVRSPRTPGRPALHILGLFTLALAHPLYSILASGEHAPFLIAHQVRTIDLLVLVLIVSFLLPVTLYLPCYVTAKASERAGAACHTSLVFILSLLFLLPLAWRWTDVGHGLSLWAWGTAAVIVSSLFTYLYRTREWARLFVSILSLGVIVAPIIFLSSDSVRALLRPPSVQDLQLSSTNNPTPDIVMIVFDELPLISLLGEELEIDTERYPNFARLAQTSTWYRNTSSVHYSTASAMAGLLSGEHYQSYLEKLKGDDATLSGPIDHKRLPHNLFSLLSGEYAIHATELVTHLAPQTQEGKNNLPPLDRRLYLLVIDSAVVMSHYLLPSGFRHYLPPIEGQWVGFAADDPEVPLDTEWPYLDSYKRISIVRQFIESLDTSNGPSLHFLHTLLPHFPFEYNEMGQKHANALPFLSMQFRKAPGHNTWPNETAANLAYQAHLLQLGFTDILLGRILDRLDSRGMLQDCVLIVTSDHGTSFFWDNGSRPAEELARIQASGTLFVPLFIKWPGQIRGEISDQPLQTIDLIPTLADFLGKSISWPHSGISALAPVARDRLRMSFLPEPFPISFTLEDEQAALRRKFQLFGKNDVGEIYRYGPYPGLVGRSMEDLPGTVSEAEARLDLRGWSVPKRIDAARFPAYIHGSLTRPADADSGDTVALSIAIDGVIKATSSASPFDLAHMLPANRVQVGANPTGMHRDVEKQTLYFSARLPPSDLMPGLDDLSIAIIKSDERGAAIALDRVKILE